MFLDRHPYLRTKLSRSIEASRIKEVARERVVEFFQEFSHILQEHNIKCENIYNVDETGLSPLSLADCRLFSWNNPG